MSASDFVEPPPGPAASPRRVAVVLVDRANYGRLRPVMAELRRRPELRLQVVCAGTMLLERFGRAARIVRADGFGIDEEVYLELEGSLPATMTLSIGLGVIAFAAAFRRLASDFVLVVGDRYEALAAAIAAVYQNICLIHVQGGEVTGSIDESTRHAITKLAHYHFPATERAGHNLARMGERADTIFAYGCPSADVAREACAAPFPAAALDRSGVGAAIDWAQPYLLLVFHPVTTQHAQAESQMEQLLAAAEQSGLQLVLLWPNIDAGGDRVSAVIRRFREARPDAPLRAYKNVEPGVYLPLLARAACAVGNSSSFVREASFVGTPVVLVGSRQDGRERCGSVRRVEPAQADIAAAVAAQLAGGRHEPCRLYGVPGVSARIAGMIAGLAPYSQKRLAYAAGEQASSGGDNVVRLSDGSCPGLL
ncbi:UDP-N-acetylglucosamine 2-epimerase [Paenibacillus cymbidii]|uniref:UDP-N-acetylglucosamine 2-epimerase n=1 Tax=Paenibacillus cymbidii TaxID=1639034 RepID=UPI001081CD2C|nr:UDP-N-acetylglucosamine 2-epimerase [Paenibacillus cymbidii]